MLRNAKATMLTVATLLAAGCASSNFKAGHQYGKQWKSVEDRRVAMARIAKSPKILPATYFAAAQLFETQGSIGRAITQYQRTIGAKHDHVDARHRLGRLLGRVGQHAEAVVMLRSAAELAPRRASLHNDLGFELAYMKEWDESEYAFRKAIELRPGFPRAWINLGMTLCQLERHDEGLDSFLAVLSEADAYYNLGLMYRGQQRYREAVDAFRTASGLNPDLTAARKQVALLVEKMKQTPPSEEKDVTNRIARTDAGVLVPGPAAEATPVGDGQTIQSVAIQPAVVQAKSAAGDGEPREDDRRYVAIDPPSGQARSTDGQPDFVDDPFGKEFLAADVRAMRSLVGPPERGDWVAATLPVADESLVCVLESVDSAVEICEADVFCHADVEVSTILAESPFVESYAVAVSFVGQPEDLQSIQSSVTPWHEFEFIFAGIREEIDCLTELGQDGEAMAIAQLYGIDLPPVPSTRNVSVATAVQTRSGRSVQTGQRKDDDSLTKKTTDYVEVPAVKRDRSRSTMAATVTPANDGTKKTRNRFARSDNAIGREGASARRVVESDGFPMRSARTVDRGTMLEQLAEQLARVREEISCLEDAAIEENLSRHIGRVQEPRDIDPGFEPTGRNQAEDKAVVEEAPKVGFASATETVHPVVAWLDNVGRDLVADWPQPQSAATPMPPKVKTAPVVPVMQDAKRPTGRGHASTRETLAARLTEKPLDGREHGFDQVGPPSEPRTTSVPSTLKESVVVSSWMEAHREILENEARCRSNQAGTGEGVQDTLSEDVTGVLPPAISFDTFLEIIGSQRGRVAVRP